MHTAVIIVAAGRGVRAGGPVPKQWQALAGRRVVDWTLAAFAAIPEITRTVLVLDPADTAHWKEFASRADLQLARGGGERADSVRAGLAALAGTGTRRVLIHDVARPCVPAALVRNVLAALENTQAAAPGLPVTDALWTGSDGQVSGVQDRNGLFAAQTPQGFDFDAIMAAHNARSGAPFDDVEVARAAGIAVSIVPGDADNLKITTPGDFERAARILLRERVSAMDIRLGNGLDVHRFCPGDHVTLCGVDVPHGRGLAGHSDADVGLHAIADAIYGALAEGDIGRHFPPSDPQWKGAPSHIFAAHAAGLARARGFAISNVDCTLICEFPKIGPHAQRMAAVTAEILGIDPGRVSVKATTSERLGFAGRGEGIAAIATAALVSS